MIAAGILIFLLICGVLNLFNTGFRRVFFSGGHNQETIGSQVAQRKGCFNCHGDLGSGGVLNPGGTPIPSFQNAAFDQRMTSLDDLRAWILDGGPSHSQEKNNGSIKMPAYRGKLTRGEVRYLMDFYIAISGAVQPQEAIAKKGLEVAAEKGCFDCHGPGGRIDLPNPFSVTGFVPSWNGPDYGRLVQNEAELRDWILDGGTSRIENNPMAQWFRSRQVINMPAYRDHLTTDELDALVAYIQWLRDPSAPDHQPVFQ